MKKCPQCNVDFEQALVTNVQVDYCPRCYGLWFEESELDLAKDEKDRSLRWLDIDLWKHEEKFQVSRGRELCPQDRMPLYEVRYGDSNVRVDVCNICNGIWLDRGEFIEIIEYLREKGTREIMHSYAKNLAEEFWEVFAGPEMLRDEVLDFLTILKVLRYKFVAQHPAVARLMLALPR
ncbi:MAG TPA: zf-TFIIB domain-containing protein [Candidatus Paceibacterota bacterium]|nr:zf-TFIIB domain-containing protein [Candidatus Paceibacterota bacterium]